jgi:ATP-dependent helicase/nuclease subunit B
LRVVLCANPEGEAVQAARELLRFARGGGRWREAAVLVRQLELYHEPLQRVFTRYDIPYFLDRREPVSHHPLAELTRYALRTVAYGWQHEDWFGALKSGLVHDDEPAIDRLENEALRNGWSGAAWQQPLRLRDESPLSPALSLSEGERGKPLAERREKLRQEIVPPFCELAERLAGPRTGATLALALRQFWDDLGVAARLEQWSRHATELSGEANPRPIHATVWPQLLEWLENLELAFPQGSPPLLLREWLPILEAGLSSLTVGVIPPALDQVLIGSVERSRNPELKLALVLGMNESVFPAPPPPAGLLTDADRATLEGQQVWLAPGSKLRLGHERYYGYIACTRASERLVLTAAQRTADDQPLNPSPFLAHLQRLFPELKIETAPPEPDWREAEHSSELVAPLLLGLRRWSSSFSLSGPERGAGGKLKLELQQPPLDARAVAELRTLPVFAPVLAKWEQLEAARQARPLSPALVEQLHGAALRASVTALEDFAECPFKFFAARSLGAEEREEFEVGHREKGSFQHELLQEFHRRVQEARKRWRELSPQETSALVAEIGEELLARHGHGLFDADAARRFTARALVAAAQKLVQTLVGWARQYDFEPHAVEVGFGLDEKGLPAWRLELGNGHALEVRGRIDRIDLWREEGGESALGVVVDYKSRARQIDSVKLQHGVELQLLSYLGVLQNVKEAQRWFGVRRVVPSGVFYVPLRGKPASGDTREEAAAGEPQNVAAAYQHAGRFDAGWLAKFDNRGARKGDQFRYEVKKDGGLAKRGNDALAPDAFQRLLREIEEHLRRIGRAIYAGEVGVAPYRKGDEKACDFCDFRPFCRFDPWVDRYRVLRAVSAAERGNHLAGRAEP